MWSRNRWQRGITGISSNGSGGHVRLSPLQAGEVEMPRYDPVRYGDKPDHLKHFWPCDEHEFSRGSHLTPSIREVVEGSTDILDIPPLGDTIGGTLPPLCADYHASMVEGSREVGIPRLFDCFADADWIILVAFKGRGESCSEFTIGRPDSGSDPLEPKGIFLKVQPYYFAINFDGTYQTQPWGYLHTKQRTAVTVNRVVGQDYMIAFVRRGDYIQHWVDGVLQGENQISKLLLADGRTHGARCLEAAEMIPKMRPKMRIRLGHSGTGLMNQALKSSNPDYDYPHMVDGDTPSYVELPAGFGQDGKQVANEPSQYCGISINAWPEGDADFPDIPSFMSWHKTRWFAGNKRVDYTP